MQRLSVSLTTACNGESSSCSPSSPPTPSDTPAPTKISTVSPVLASCVDNEGILVIDGVGPMDCTCLNGIIASVRHAKDCGFGDARLL